MGMGTGDVNMIMARVQNMMYEQELGHQHQLLKASLLRERDVAVARRDALTLSLGAKMDRDHEERRKRRQAFLGFDNY